MDYSRENNLNRLGREVFGDIEDLSTVDIAKYKACDDMYEALKNVDLWFYQGASGDYRITGQQIKQALAKAEAEMKPKTRLSRQR
ncbi:hypothetical protein LCGC14_2713800 [marine sediment metagenome]|uniref:Uncharacterized protein n=1 Tax=marine sediment metagenome TaxID=412755 RepID=A0A0F9C412_9ZZZZ